MLKLLRVCVWACVLCVCVCVLMVEMSSRGVYYSVISATLLRSSGLNRNRKRTFIYIYKVCTSCALLHPRFCTLAWFIYATITTLRRYGRKKCVNSSYRLLSILTFFPLFLLESRIKYQNCVLCLFSVPCCVCDWVGK